MAKYLIENGAKLLLRSEDEISINLIYNIESINI